MPRQPQAVSGLFGETPQAIRQSQIDERIGQASMIGQLGRTGQAALLGGSVARGIGGLLGAAQDPRLRQAQIYKEIEQNITQMGLQPGTAEFTQAVTQQVSGRLGTQAGIEAQQKAQALEVQQAAVRALRSEPAARQRKIQGQMRLLSRLDYDGEDAYALVEAGLGDWAIKQKLTPEKSVEKIRMYQQLYGPEWPAFLKRDLAKSGITIENNIGAKAASRADRESVRRADGSMYSAGTTVEELQRAIMSGEAVELTPEQQAGDRVKAVEAAKLEAASAALPKAIQDYERAVELPGSSVWGTAAHEIARDAKRHLATQIAIMESRGAEPGDVKLRRSIEGVPDYGGFIDAARFANRMKEFKERHLGPEAAASYEEKAAAMLRDQRGG